MADGIYIFENVQKEINGSLEVSRGKFWGENAQYKYEGNFNIINKQLIGKIIVTYKNIDFVEGQNFSTVIEDDEKFTIPLTLSGKEIVFICTKERDQHRSFSAE